MLAILWQWVWYDARWRARLIAAPVFAASLTLVWIAASLSPDGRGHGTHEKLGLPSCSVQVYADQPCPSCGMTTAFSHVVRGQLLAAVSVQPAGTALALVALAALGLSGYVLATGARLDWVRRLWRIETLIIAVVLLVGSWVYKLAEAGAFS